MLRTFLTALAAAVLASSITMVIGFGHHPNGGATVSDDTLRTVNQPGNLLRTVQNMIDQDAAGQLFRATVVETTDTTIRIQRTGHDPDVAQHAVLDNFPYPRVGDEVLMARVGSGWMVVGSILRSGLTENYLKIETVLQILPGGRMESSSLKICSLMSGFSVAASMAMSADAKSLSAPQGLMRPTACRLADSSILPFSTNLVRIFSMRCTAFSTAPSHAS